jgi:hypothetical protein
MLPPVLQLYHNLSVSCGSSIMHLSLSFPCFECISPFLLLSKRTRPNKLCSNVHLQSAAYQKDRARRRAFHQWELEYHLARVCNDLQVSATGLPLDRAAYQYVISQPPSEVNHPLWTATVAMEKDKRG